jgi:hypothetical protein
MGLVLGKEDVDDENTRPESPTFSEPDEPAPPPPPEKKAARPTMVGGTSLFNLFAQKEEPAAPPPPPKPAPPNADRPMVGGQSLFNLFSREEPDDSAAPAEPRAGILEKVGSATGSLLNLLGGMGSDPGEDAEAEAATKMQAKVRGSLERKKSAEAKKEPPKAGGQCCVIA